MEGVSYCIVRIMVTVWFVVGWAAILGVGRLGALSWSRLTWAAVTGVAGEGLRRWVRAAA